MLLDHKNNSFGCADLSADSNRSINELLYFIHDNINGFRDYYLQSPKPQIREESINTLLARYFNSLIRIIKNGEYPFYFEKHPADDDSFSEPDFGVSITNPSSPEDSIFEIEAKRLSSDISTNRQYVYGQNRGAIERFKRMKHGKKISTCGIMGYVQSLTCLEWYDCINQWIDEEIDHAHDSCLEWNQSDRLKHFALGEKYLIANSISKRIDNTNIKIHHYLIDLKV